MFKFEASAASILDANYYETFDSSKIDLTNEGNIIVCNI